MEIDVKMAKKKWKKKHIDCLKDECLRCLIDEKIGDIYLNVRFEEI